MPSFKHRSYEKELLDGSDIPFAEIKRNMQELNVINSMLGGHRCTLKGIKNLADRFADKKSIHIVEIGCGGGDNLRVVREWLNKNHFAMNLTGIDINAECIEFARSIPENAGIYFITSDYKSVEFTRKPDIIFSSLFCHHFTDEQLVFMLQWMQCNTSTGFFINDLHRHPLAYYSIRFLTGIFSRSRLVRNDAPISVRRGFKREDWVRLFRISGISSFQCIWSWAFRWLIICNHE